MLNRYFITVPTHPVFWYTNAYMVGIGYQYVYSDARLLDNQAFILLAVIAMCACFFLSRIFFPKKIWALFVIFFFVLGAVRMQSATLKKTADSALLTDGPADLIARVCAIEHRKSGPFKTKMLLAVTSITRNNVTTSMKAYIQLSLIRRPAVEVGDNIRIHNASLKIPPDGSFRTYLFKEGCVATAFIPSLSFELLHHPYWSFARTCATVQQNIYAKLSAKLSRSAASLYFPLFLGTKTATNSPIRKGHTQWGIVHFLARSGLHIMLLAASWSYMLRILPLNYFIKQLILLLLVLLYYLLTFPSISFLRALITYVLYKICILHNVSSHPLHILSLTTFVVLLFNPFQLFFLDFQLSFGLTFALAWYNELKIRKQRLILF